MSDELDKLLSAGRAAEEQKSQEQKKQAAALDAQKQRERIKGTLRMRRSLSFWGFLFNEEFLFGCSFFGIFAIFPMTIIFSYVLLFWVLAFLASFGAAVGLAYLWCNSLYFKKRGQLNALPYHLVGYWSLLDKRLVRAVNLWVHFKEPVSGEILARAAKGLRLDNFQAEMKGDKILCCTQNPLYRKHDNYAFVRWFDWVEHRFLRVIGSKFPIEGVVVFDFGDKPPTELTD